MKIAVFAPLLLLAGALAALGAGPAAAADHLPRAATLTDFHGDPWGIVGVSLRVENGLFTVKRPGRLRTYPRKYTYRLTNMDFWGGDELVIDRLTPATCGLRYLALSPVQLTGEFGEPDAWRPTVWQRPGDPNLSWACQDPYTEGLFPESSFQFELFSDAESSFGPLLIEGKGVDGQTFFPRDVKSEVLYPIPGCLAAPPALTPEFDLEAAATAQVAPGHFATFTIRARNVGRAAATSAELLASLPAWLLYQPGSLTRDGAPLDDGGWNLLQFGLPLDTLAPDGATTEIRFQARVAAGVAVGTTFAFAPSLTCAQTESLESEPATLKVAAADRNAPTIAILSPASGVISEDAEIAIAYQVADTDPGLDASRTRATLDGRWVENGARIDPFTLGAGSHTFTVIAVDLAGNQGTQSVTFEVAATVRTTIQQVLRLHAAGLIKTVPTVSALNTSLKIAQSRLEAGDIAGGLNAIAAFHRCLNSPVRRALIDPAAVSLLNASAEYLLQHPAP
jgi:uncharacterized repeat protein (TIGR01451 family)